MEVSPLLGRRVEIHGLTSQQGQQLNGKVGLVIKQLEAGRLGVRLNRGDRSIHQNNLRERPLASSEILECKLLEAVPKWPLEVVVFYNSNQHDNYPGADPEDDARQMHHDHETGQENFGRHTAFSCLALVGFGSLPENHFCTLLSYGLSFHGMLKVVLRRVAEIDPFHFNALDPNGDGSIGSAELTILLRTAQATGRDAELVGSFGSADLLRAILAADRIPFECLICDLFYPRSRQVRPALRALAAALWRCGVSVRGLAEQAKTEFQHLCADPETQVPLFRDPNATWLRAQMDQDRFNRRVEKWCAWEEKQWRLIMRTFGQRGLGLPGAAAALIASCIAGRQYVTSQTSRDQTVHVMQEVQHNEPVPQIDEEVAHAAVQLEADEAFAQQVEARILEGEDLNHNADGQVDDIWIETDS